MSMLAGPIYALAGIIGIAGALKLTQPGPATRALRAAGLPGSLAAVRVLGMSEMVIGAIAISLGTTLTATSMAVYYAGFAVFALVLMRRGGNETPCGCFGEPAAPEPTTWVHVTMNLIATVLCLAAVLWPTGGVLDVLANQPWAGIPFLVLTALCGWLWYLALTAFPALLAASARTPETASAS